MSRIGKKPIPIPKSVTVKVAGDAVEVTGPKGVLTTPFPPGVTFEVKDGQIQARTIREDKELGKFHGLARSLVANAVAGVTDGFKRELDIVGVGYRAEVKGREVHFALGYSHPIVLDVPEGLTVSVEGVNKIKIEGIDRDRVGQFAAELRGLRPPEPYKGKGVRYSDERIRRKVGKAGAGA